METTRKEKMADSRLAILMALFLQELFTNFVMFNQNTKTTGEIIFSVTQNRT